MFSDDDSWLSNLTSADGSDITFDPVLLEEDEASEDDVDGDYTDDDLHDKYDELGRTPPRQVVARNRKWSSDKKLMRDHDRR